MRRVVALVFVLVSLVLIACEPAGVRQGREAYDRGDFDVALAALRPLADDGNTDALRLLGFMYHDGSGVPRDYDAALKLWREAVDETDPAEQYARGREIQTAAFEKYFQGKGADKRQFRTALMWFRLAAEQGYTKAQSYLGDIYLNFEFAGIAPDTTEGEKWLRQAAEHGDLNGQINLGDLYNDGLIGPKNYKEAAKWYRRAAGQGSPAAQFILARMYRDGRGVAKDLVRAHMWFSIALANGDGTAIPMLDRIEKKLAPGQVAKAKQLAADWLSAHGQGAAKTSKAQPG